MQSSHRKWFCSTGFQALHWIILIVPSVKYITGIGESPFRPGSFILGLKGLCEAARHMNGWVIAEARLSTDHEHSTQQSLTSLHLNGLQTRFPLSLAIPPLSPGPMGHGGHTFRLESEGERCWESRQPPACPTGWETVGTEVTSRWDRQPETVAPSSALSWGRLDRSQRMRMPKAGASAWPHTWGAGRRLALTLPCLPVGLACHGRGAGVRLRGAMGDLEHGWQFLFFSFFP